MFDYALLSALAAVIRTGSFERAARQLNVTPSAISQRIKLLEDRMGTVLVIRGQPCEGSALGQRLCQHAEQVALLESSFGGQIPAQHAAEPMAVLRVAVTADSLATWFISAMAQTRGCLFDVVLDDQAHSADWLRSGEVLAAVTGHGKPVQGCDRYPLGSLRYIATASPGFLDRWCPEGFDEQAAMRAPCLTFNRKDQLQTQWLQQLFGKELTPPTHWLPSSHAFVDAARAGLGWGMNPEALVADDLRAGRLVELKPHKPLDVPLFWQHSRIASGALADVTQAVLQAGRDTLKQTTTPVQT